MTEPDEKRQEAIDHLQSAGLEMIDAVRALLDVVEEVVGDRDKLERLADSVTDVARTAGRIVAERPVSPPDADDGVQHIDLS